jgi:hypothetical protein
MRSDFPDKGEIDQAFRMLMRSRHIYILLSSLVHLALGVYMQLRTHPIQKLLQIAGSSTLTAASVLLVYAFVVETYELHGFSNFSRYGLYLSLAGIGLHLFGGLEIRRRGK